MKEHVAKNPKQEDLLIRNGRIYTMDDADTVAQAVLISTNCYRYLGKDG